MTKVLGRDPQMLTAGSPKSRLEILLKSNASKSS